MVADPEPATLIGVIAPQVRLDGAVSLKVTVPVNWFRPVTVMFDVAVEPTFTAAGSEAEIVKSWNLKVAVVVWMRDPLAPIKVRV